MPRSSATSPIRHRRALWWTAAAVSVALVLVATMAPQETERGTNWVPLAQSKPAVKAVLASPNPFAHPAFPFVLWQVGGNVLAFVPVGLSFAGLGKGRGFKAFGRAVAAAFLLSLLIETLQLFLPTRATDVDDLIFNTAGAAVGAMLFFAFGRHR